VVHAVNSVTDRFATGSMAALTKLEITLLLLRFLALPWNLWLCALVAKLTAWTTSL